MSRPPPNAVNTHPWLETLSPKQIRWALILVAVLLVANLQVVLEPVTFVSAMAMKKIRGEGADCPWPRVITLYWDISDFLRLRAVEARVLDRDEEFGIVLVAHPAVERQFWIREQGQHMDGPTLLSFLIGEQQWIVRETPEARLKEGDIVVDCGAHVGAFSDRAFQEGAAKVVAFFARGSTIRG